MSVDATNAPVRRPAPELHTGDIRITQKPVIETREDTEGEIVVAPESLENDYQAQLAFMEEPVTIRIERSAEKFPPRVIDCWVNGKGAEVLINNKWVETRAIPVGMPVTTKRKYVEVVARAKVENVNTHVEKRPDSEVNEIHRNASARAPFSVIHDANPKGAAWLTGIVSQL